MRLIIIIYCAGRTTLSKDTVEWLASLDPSQKPKDLPLELQFGERDLYVVLSEMYRTLTDNRNVYFVNNYTLSKRIIVPWFNILGFK